jgi:hypothetical protein
LKQHNSTEGTGKTYNGSTFQGGQKTLSRTGMYFMKLSEYTLTHLSYTVLVRRYQNQGITLPSRASSPSDCSTPAPLPNYTLDDDYPYDTSSSYNNLMPPQHQGTSAGSHHSWSSLDSEAAVSAWSNPQDYTLPMNVPAPNMTHAIHPLPNYALAPPHTHASAHWDWTSTSPNPMHARSPVSYNTSPAPPHYDDYGMPHPHAGRSTARASYPGVLPNAVPTSNMPRTRAWSEQQPYDSLAPSAYPDSSLQQQDPLYRF